MCYSVGELSNAGIHGVMEYAKGMWRILKIVIIIEILEL